MNRRLPRLHGRGCGQAFEASLWILLASQVFIAGCAKTGEPHPPTILIPKPAVDLAARQNSDRVLRTVSAPVQNTNGSPVTSPGAVEVWCRAEDRTASGAPLKEPEFFKGAEKIQTVPGDKVAGLRHGKALEFRDELAVPDRSQIYTKEYRYAVRFLNRKKQSAGLSNQVVVAPIPIPSPPANLSAEVTQEAVRLRWTAPAENMDGSSPPRLSGYNIYRTEDPKSFPPAPLNQDLLSKPEFDDRAFEFDRTYYYSVSVVGSREHPYAESQASAPVRVLTRDTFPPGAPQNLNAVQAGQAILLLWTAPPDRDIAGYRVYRREGGEGASRLLQQGIKELSYRDEQVQPGKKYLYRVTAVDTHGNEGPAAETEGDVR